MNSRVLELLAIMARLRAADGCPWDRQQTFASIAPYTIEEAYEVADAIEKGDMGGLKDELGDLLLQVVYHARMAEEDGAFDFADVAQAITAKMIRRHPHVFGSEAERAAGAAPGFWERIKAKEKAPSADGGVLDDVPAALPRSPAFQQIMRKKTHVRSNTLRINPLHLGEGCWRKLYGLYLAGRRTKSRAHQSNAQQPNAYRGEFHISENLCLMNLEQLLDAFQFNNQPIVCQ